MRTLQYAEAYEIVHRYDKAAGQDHEDFPTMQRILRQMRENPLMSRFEWCTLVKDLCDERLLDDFVKTIDGITQGSDEGSQDMRNSLDPEECVQQEVNQDRSRPQREMQNAAKYHKMKKFFKNDEERERYSILAQGSGAGKDANNFSGNSGQKRKSGSFKRGGKKHKKEGESSQRSDQNKGNQKRPWKSNKKGREGFRPVADQNK
ncbi:Oidioi.mRNA.OKI2018_I69.YSR.g17074.t1.cds [Oikopleura dioica]|uniref:Oidioi.mRNA.OKI2018_I69.YSR.g17074.t1.cds n=1 Tax=Oikopleura dioica TaxID=34765 RepID=A0ABN7SJW3_OIKDI|nr:Oidioi.mRNA.OKI2018_I69.YSR.g17074.t1.cds [Oikopleura dioica]